MACEGDKNGDISLNISENRHSMNFKDDYPSGNILRSMVLFSMVTLGCIVLVFKVLGSGSPLLVLPGSLSFSFPIPQTDNSTVSNTTVPAIKKLGLDEILKNTAMPDKTVIISPLNEAWIEQDSIFGLFLESFRIGIQTGHLVKHLLVVALDQKAFDHCLKLNLNCYFLVTEGVDFSGEARFMTGDYLKMVWRKIDFLRTVLEKGYNFIFTDADIMWLRNPIPSFHNDADFQVSCDIFLGRPSNLDNRPNTGLMYVKASNRTTEFYKFWYNSRVNYSTMHDQDAFNMIKFNPFVREIGMKIKFLSTAHFGGFCQSSKNYNLLSTMHANCCAGLDNKIHDLKVVLQEWRNYLSLPENLRQSHPPLWTLPQNCGPASFRPRARVNKNDTNSKN